MCHQPGHHPSLSVLLLNLEQSMDRGEAVLIRHYSSAMASIPGQHNRLFITMHCTMALQRP